MRRLGPETAAHCPLLPHQSDRPPWTPPPFESKLGPRLKVVALIDPSACRADAALSVKRNSFVLSAYKDTVVYPSFEEYVKKRPKNQKPQ